MSKVDNEKNRRKRERLNLSLPIRVQCRQTLDETWEEITHLIDVTPFGAGFMLSRSVEIGKLLLLTIPMPRQLRCYDHIEPQYRVWGLVRHVRENINAITSKVNYSIGTAFVGKNPPASFTENPARLYEVVEPDALGFWRLREVKPEDATDHLGSGQKTSGVDLRRYTRHQIPMSVTIEVFNDRGETVASEMTVTEDISQTGASVFTTLDVANGRLVRLSSDEYDVTIIAIIRSRKIGKDGVARLHLEFIDRQFPLDTSE